MIGSSVQVRYAALTRTTKQPTTAKPINRVIPLSGPPSNAGATGAFGEDCLSATADGGAGAPLAGMRPGSGMPAHRHDCGRMRAYTVASPMGPLLRAPVRARFSRGRVPQPPVASSNAGHPEGAVQWGGLLWLTFLGRARKVSSCRATPGLLMQEPTCSRLYASNTGPTASDVF
jgi:hypothetical protein